MKEDIKKTYEIIERGTARVRMEPRGDHGLEGFSLDERIEYHIVKQYRTDKKHYRLYLPYGQGYYETCGYNVFHQYFVEESSHEKEDFTPSSRRRI